MAKVVSVHDVETKTTPHQHTINSCMKTLLKQGFIEPLCVTQDECAPYQINDENWYDDAYVFAARALGWDTVLIVKS